ncbi:Shikimate kinase [Legionella massiliensis]|uniref:Shikimate kinase n=1 Tax=Legionella massiliensis TaxID=1034943 RepID=A0A078KX68_9GAMM|nr:shikimate kinase [Legionella massiliensis]CDZ78995.1 Shikimate kinase [Legionella massiliensis]CEE14733.1 Shikimate kinase [Legionella massiliensis]
MTEYKRIFIVGQPGAGKGLIAKMLAEKLGWRFVDADLGIEFNIGKTLRDICGTEGESQFLSCQNEILSSLITKENIVVATDGTIACNEQNRQILRSEFTVFLQVTTASQLQRTSRDNLPLLAGDMREFFDLLHQQRDEDFEKVATLSIDTEDNNVERHILNITKQLAGGSKVEGKNTLIELETKDLILFHKQQHHPINLTEQQARCLKLLAKGKTSKEIALLLGISYRTVEGNLAKLMEDTGCSSSKELIVLYLDKP